MEEDKKKVHDDDIIIEQIDEKVKNKANVVEAREEIKEEIKEENKSIINEKPKKSQQQSNQKGKSKKNKKNTKSSANDKGNQDDDFDSYFEHLNVKKCKHESCLIQAELTNCSYCKETYCSDHNYPLNHNCETYCNPTEHKDLLHDYKAKMMKKSLNSKIQEMQSERQKKNVKKK